MDWRKWINRTHHRIFLLSKSGNRSSPKIHTHHKTRLSSHDLHRYGTKSSFFLSDASRRIFLERARICADFALALLRTRKGIARAPILPTGFSSYSHMRTHTQTDANKVGGDARWFMCVPRSWALGEEKRWPSNRKIGWRTVFYLCFLPIGNFWHRHLGGMNGVSEFDYHSPMRTFSCLFLCGQFLRMNMQIFLAHLSLLDLAL